MHKDKTEVQPLFSCLCRPIRMPMCVSQYRSSGDELHIQYVQYHALAVCHPHAKQRSETIDVLRGHVALTAHPSYSQQQDEHRMSSPHQTSARIACYI